MRQAKFLNGRSIFAKLRPLHLPAPGANGPARHYNSQGPRIMGLSINLEGKVALITGASSGLGARFAHVLAAAGAKVVLASAGSSGSRSCAPISNRRAAAPTWCGWT